MDNLKAIVKICERADRMGIAVDSRINHILDIEFAVKEFNIDLTAWLESDNFNFMHDFIGIYRNIDRTIINNTHDASGAFNCFVPRFARREN